MSLQESLIGHWSMDRVHRDSGVIRDISGYNNHGNLSDGASLVTGNVRESLDGEAYTGKKLYPDNSITISFWAYARDSGTEDILGTFDFGAGTGIGFAREDGGSEIKWAVGNFVGPSTSLSLEQWDHYVGIFNQSSEKLKLYKNASLAELNDGVPGFTEGNTFQIGTAPNGRFFNGRIDEVRVYNRALSNSEINALYQQRDTRQTSSRGFPVAAENLVARYPFRDGSATDDARNENYADPTAYDGTIGGAIYRSKEGHTSDGGFDFNGSDTKDINFPNDAVQTGNSTRTTMGWFKVENDTGNRQMAFGSANGRSGEAWEMELYGVFDGSSTTTLGALSIHTWGGYNKTSADVISLNEWVHFAATHDGNPSNIQIYLNGEPISTENNNNNSSSLNTSSALHRSGYSEGHGVGKHTFSGQAADLRIYNKDLSDSEIRTIYQNTRPQISASGGSTITTETINGEQYRIHAFEDVGTSTFEVSDAQANATADVLVVGGGGAGGGEFSGGTTAGGGGGGGILYEDRVDMSKKSYSVEVGDGGSPTDADGNKGGDTSFDTFTAYGGGGGAQGKVDNDAPTYNNYGGGGGASGNDDSVSGAPATSQGNKGGDGTLDGGSDGVLAGGGGGGTLVDVGGAGGDGGDYSDLFGTQFGENGVFAGGGGAGQSASGGLGGGGTASSDSNDSEGPGVDGTGGGGGAGEGNQQGFTGGSGIVLIRYKL